MRFGAPDLTAFPLLKFAYDCLREGKAMPAVLNAANEVAVDAFLNYKIGFLDIVRCVESTLTKMSGTTTDESIEAILKYDTIARRYATEFIK